MLSNDKYFFQNEYRDARDYWFTTNEFEFFRAIDTRLIIKERLHEWVYLVNESSVSWHPEKIIIGQKIHRHRAYIIPVTFIIIRIITQSHDDKPTCMAVSYLCTLSTGQQAFIDRPWKYVFKRIHKYVGRRWRRWRTWRVM